jgi:hypothetical protein
MDKELERFFEPWELKILELIEEVKKEKNQSLKKSKDDKFCSEKGASL